MLFGGVMMGTSVDAIDVAFCRFEPQLELVHFHSTPLDAQLRERILRLCRNEGSVRDVCEMNREIGEQIARACQAALESGKILASDVACIGSHGQTVWHEVAGDRTSSTLQIGDGSVVAARLGVPVASDFRVADVAAGGNGAPFAPIFDAAFLRPAHSVRALLNVGGISNVSVLSSAAEEPTLSCDCGPGCCLIDRAARLIDPTATMDRDGEFARRGNVSDALLSEMLSLEFFSLPPPKSTGRELFSEAYFCKCWARAQTLQLSAYDFVATLTELSARAIADSLKRFCSETQPTELFVAGGGARNVFLMERLAALLPGCQVQSHDVLFDGAAKEAALFALLAFNCFNRRPSLPNGAILGKLSFPPQKPPGVGRPANALYDP